MFAVLKNRAFARLYFAQAISLLGDAITWVGIALLAFELGRGQPAAILATALTLRVGAFILFGPYAGVLADRIDRKRILYVTHFARMGLVALLPFVHQEWQLYAVVFLMNVFNAFFTPAYKAAIPQSVADPTQYGAAVTLSNATWQLLGVLGPGLAGGLAAFMGARQIFFLDAATFVVAGILIVGLRGGLSVAQASGGQALRASVWADIVQGTRWLFAPRALRFALLIELVAAVAGAQILVNSVGHIKGVLALDDAHYGWAMTAFGVGATLAAFAATSLDKSKDKRWLLVAGGLVISLAIGLANFASYPVLLCLWALAGIGQSFAELPSQILIADNTPLERQGRVYGAHFAWSHLWWAIGYPLAGFAGTQFAGRSFLVGGMVCLGLLGVALAYRLLQPKAGPGPLNAWDGGN